VGVDEIRLDRVFVLVGSGLRGTNVAVGDTELDFDLVIVLLTEELTLCVLVWDTTGDFDLEAEVDGGTDRLLEEETRGVLVFEKLARGVRVAD